jgi:cell division septation protein DedD
VAAREPLEKGRTPVVTKPAAPPETTSEIRDTVPGKASAMLQVASYKDQVSAHKLLEDLSSDGYSGTVLRADLGERGIWYRVRIGPYAKGEEAELILKRLREERDLKGYVVK